MRSLSFKPRPKTLQNDLNTGDLEAIRPACALNFQVAGHLGDQCATGVREGPGSGDALEGLPGDDFSSLNKLKRKKNDDKSDEKSFFFFFLRLLAWSSYGCTR